MKIPLASRWFHKMIVAAALTSGFLAPGKAFPAASGNIFMITSNPDLEEGTKGFAGFLRRLGYTVTVTGPGDATYFTLDTDAEATRAARIAQLESYDLIVIHRNFGSATLASSEAEIAIWNHLRVPLLLCNAPIVRNNRWRWMNASSGGITTSSPNLIIDQPTHPIVAGLGADLFKANRVYGGMIQGNDGGAFATHIARASITGFDPICLTVWDEGAGEERDFYSGSGQSYFRRRVFFELHEYRNNPDAAVNDPWKEITENGERLFANSVEYAITGTVVPEVPPQIVDLMPADGSAFWLVFDPIRFRVTSGEPLPSGSIRLALNGADVSADLALGGSPTDRTATYNQLQLNRAYQAVITASNSFGSRTVQTRFDTFDPAEITTLSTPDEMSYSGNVPAGVYRVYLRVTSTTARTLALRPGSDPANPVQGVFYAPVTGQPAQQALIPLTDALGNELLLRLSGAQTFVLTGGGPGTTSAEIICALAHDAPAVLLPVLALASPEPNAAAVSPLAGIALHLANRDTRVEPLTIRFFLNEVELTSQAAITDTGAGAQVNYQPPIFFAPGSSHRVRVTFADSAMPAHLMSGEYVFFVRNIPAIPSAFATALNSGTDPGFNIRNHMAPGATGVNFTNTSARAELQLAGLLTGPGGMPVTNAINGTPFASSSVETGVINYGQTAGGVSGRFPSDGVFPGGETVSGNNIALEVTAYVSLAAGLNRFGVRSDDGFRLTAGESLTKQDVMLSGYEGPRGDQVPTEFDVLVYQAGLYALRFVYYDGGGGASLEWYGIYENGASPDGTDGRVLLNGPDSAMAIRAPAFRNRSAQPTISPPTLKVARDGNDVVLSWTSQVNFQLESNSNLNTSLWMPVAQPPDTNGDRKSVRWPAGIGSSFFRLQRP